MRSVDHIQACPTSDAGVVAPKPFNSLVFGPDYKAETEYSNGSIHAGYGSTRAEAEANSRSISSSYWKS